jgi:creatinine amidohydrolase/Fe(II)-dependent formamide hydrolase-like protein
MPRPWTRVTDDTGVGNPGEATATLGAAFVEDAVSRICALCAELDERHRVGAPLHE